MTSFLNTCRCRGRQPDGILALRHVPRADLIAAMLRQRDVARFVVAPAGSGRTTLACEYASIVFGFDHVFWVPCPSPCFLRDLDAGTLASGILELDPSAKLVVWEDVPQLSAERAQEFGRLIDELLAAGVEVLVTCAPLADGFAGLQRDRVLLTADDLLLSSAEMRAEAVAGRLAENWEAQCVAADRIACVRWGGDGERRLIEGLAQEEMPSEMRLCCLALLTLGHGSIDELSGFLAAERAEEAVGLLAEHYPLFGIDRRTGLFHGLEVGPERIAESFGRSMGPMAEASLFDSRDVLVAHLADALLAQGRVERATEVVGAFMEKRAAAGWLGRNGYRILMAGAALAFVDLCQRVQRRARGTGAELGVMGAWAACMLGDAAPGASEAARVAACPTATARSRMSAAVLSARCALGDERHKALALLEECLAQAEGEPLAANEAMALRADGIDWLCLGPVALKLGTSPEEALGQWFEGLRGQRAAAEAPEAVRAHRNALLLGAAWLLDEHASSAYAAVDDALRQRMAEHGAGARSMGTLDDVARYVRDAVERESMEGSLGWCAVTAGSALERLVADQPRFVAYSLAPEAAARLHQAEVALFEQRDASRRLASAGTRAIEVAPGGSRTALPGDPSVASAHPLGVPLLHVRLFGGLQVAIGDKPVATRDLSRHKTRLLLALLVLNRGHEVSRRRLAEELWPTSIERSAMKNFYSVWSQLRRALSVDGECPYLIRTREGCRLDDRLLVADVDDFEALCRSLHFRQGEDQNWEQLYTQACNDYGEDLLPCDDDNETVNALRQHYHTLLVEALLSASRWLGQNGDPRGALWFAREGLRRDDRREDVYVALMESQVLSGQRCDAMDTYFACRRFLSEELGIDPSPRLVELYRSVIESEQPLA